MEGLILFNKPKNYTSTEITNFFKKLTKKKVGHGGTLDPLAEGLLIIGIGEGTKELTKFLKESRKTYIAEIVLGAISKTYDAEGEIIETGKPIPEFSKIEKVLKSFIGEIEQIPPPYSAIKIKGKRASDLVREGKKVELKAKKVRIYRIEIKGIVSLGSSSEATNLDSQLGSLDAPVWPSLTLWLKHSPTAYPNLARRSCENSFGTSQGEQINTSSDSYLPKIKIEVEVSSGTYIRSLAHDLGEKLGCGAYLNSLIRTKIKFSNSSQEFATENIVSLDSSSEATQTLFATLARSMRQFGLRLRFGSNIHPQPTRISLPKSCEHSPETSGGEQTDEKVHINSRESTQQFATDENVCNSSQQFTTIYNEYHLEQALTFEDIEKDYLEFIAKIYGRVQGVGFRFFVESWANKLKIFGYAKNLIDGTVEVLAQGKEKDLQTLIENLKRGPKLAKVEKIDIIFRKPLKYFYDFRIG